MTAHRGDLPGGSGADESRENRRPEQPIDDVETEGETSAIQAEKNVEDGEPELSIGDASLTKLAQALLAFAYEQIEKRES